MIDMNSRNKTFIACIKRIANSEDGKKVLKVLKDDYVDHSVLSDTVESTYYKLGQKELVQALLNYLKDKDSLDSVTIL